VNLRTVLLIIVPVVVVAWWLLHENPEARVRNAHEDLARLVSKAEDDTNSTSFLNARALQALFAERCAITGDADAFTQIYTPEELVRTVIGVQARFDSLQLTFGELTIVFPTSDEAAVSFRATLEGRSSIGGDEAVVETRDVVSQMRNVDGEWLFSRFQLTDY